MVAVCGLLLLALVAGCGGGARELEIRVAKRTEKFTYPGGQQTAAPTDPKEQVLLVFKVAGITREEFDAAPKDKVFLTAGATTHKVHLLGDSEARGGSVSLFASVPRSELRFTLHVGDRPPLTFEAEQAVLPDLQPRK